MEFTILFRPTVRNVLFMIA